MNFIYLIYLTTEMGVLDLNGTQQSAQPLSPVFTFTFIGTSGNLETAGNLKPGTLEDWGKLLLMSLQ